MRRPRACGAVPTSAGRPLCAALSSPRLRGCSGGRARPVAAQGVVPAPAGLFPRTCPNWTSGTSRPRACGAVPSRVGPLVTPEVSSPRLRGCSPAVPGRRPRRRVVPARAGLFRPNGRPCGRPTGRLRACAANSVLPAGAGPGIRMPSLRVWAVPLTQRCATAFASFRQGRATRGSLTCDQFREAARSWNPVGSQPA